MQFILGLEGRSRVGLQRQLVDQPGFGEVRLRRARTPRAAHIAVEAAVGQEVQELAVHAPLRLEAVVAIGGGVDGLAAAHRPQAHLHVHVGGGGDIGQPLAVMRPRQVGGLIHAVLLHQRVRAAVHIQHPQSKLLVGVRDALAVGRGRGEPAHGVAAAALALGRAHAVGGQQRHFQFAGCVADGGQAVAIGHEGGLAVADARAMIHIHRASLLHGHHEHAATQRERHAIAIRRNMRRAHGAGHILHPTFAHLVEVRGEVDVQRAVGALCKVEHMQVGPQLVRHAVAVDRAAADVEVGVAGVLLQVGAVQLHRPQVHAAAAIAGEHHAITPRQRASAGAVVVGGARRRLRGGRIGRGQREAPQLLCGAALVAVGVTALELQAREHEVRCIQERRLAALRQRNGRAGVALQVVAPGADGGQVAARVGGVQQRAVGFPSGGADAPRVPCAAHGQAADKRHGVHLARTFIGGGERQRGAVRRDRRIAFLARVAGEPRGVAAVDVHAPQVAFRHEHQGVAVDGGHAVVAAGRSGCVGVGGRHKRKGGERDGANRCMERLHGDRAYRVRCG